MPLKRILKDRTLEKVKRRMLTVQNLWSYKYMQLYGYIYALLPVYEKLFDKDIIAERMKEEGAYFNTHPYMASYIAGVHARMLQNGDPEEKIVNFRNNLMSPLASIGDSFFWFTLRNVLIGFTSVCIMLFFRMPVLIIAAALISLIFFNVFHFRHRFTGFDEAYKSGDITMYFTKKFFFFERTASFFSYLLFMLTLGFLILETVKICNFPAAEYALFFLIFFACDIFSEKYFRGKHSGYLIKIAAAALIFIFKGY